MCVIWVFQGEGWAWFQAGAAAQPRGGIRTEMLKAWFVCQDTDSLKKQLEDEKRSRLVQEAGFLEAWNWIETGAKFRSVVFVFMKSWNCLQQESIFPGCSNWSYQKCVRNPVLLILDPNTFRVISFYPLQDRTDAAAETSGEDNSGDQVRVAESKLSQVVRTGRSGWDDPPGQDWTARCMTLRRKETKSRTRVQFFQ